MGVDLCEARYSKLKNEIIPKLVKEGKFKGSNAGTEIEKIVIQETNAGSDHWASATVFGEVHLKTNEVRSVEKIIVKYSPVNEEFSKFLLSELLYENEKVVYQDVIPKYSEFLKKQSDVLGDPDVATILDGMFPVCYYAEYDPNEPELATVVLKNVGVEGFGPPQQRVNLDLDHVKICVANLAKYHGVSYAYKLSKKSECEELMSKLKQARWCELNRPEKGKPVIVKLSTQRAIRRLIKDNTGEIKMEVLKRIEKIFDVAFDVMIYLTRKGETSVLNHGDFCVNNLMFRYDQSGKPEKLMMIDFQTPFYSSPAIDLSFFIYVSTDKKFRDQYFDEVFRLYHSTVVDTISKILGRPIKEPGFTLEDFKKDFTNHAAYGYVIASFFLPVMLNIHKEPFDLEEDVRRNNIETEEERRAEMESRGGEETTQILVSLFKEMYHKKCFDDLLNNFPVDEFFKKI